MIEPGNWEKGRTQLPRFGKKKSHVCLTAFGVVSVIQTCRVTVIASVPRNKIYMSVFILMHCTKLIEASAH